MTQSAVNRGATSPDSQVMVRALAPLVEPAIGLVEKLLRDPASVVSGLPGALHQIATNWRTPLLAMSLPWPRAMNSPRSMTR